MPYRAESTHEWCSKRACQVNIRWITFKIPWNHNRHLSHLIPAPYSAFKASIYRRTGAGLFIESSTQQAMEIANLASNYVLCWGDGRMYAPGLLPQQRIKVEHIIKVFMANPVTAIKKVRMRLGYKWRTGTVHHK